LNNIKDNEKWETTKNEKITINNKRVLKRHAGNIRGIGWI
jgi:hypothetical protein